MDPVSLKRLLMRLLLNPSLSPYTIPRLQTQSKAEWLLGYTHAQMSYHKALEVLGVSEAVVEEERARRLGELGLNGRTSMSDSFIVREGDDICRGFFTKRRRSASQDATSLGITLPGTVVFPPTTVRRKPTDGT